MQQLLITIDQNSIECIQSHINTLPVPVINERPVPITVNELVRLHVENWIMALAGQYPSVATAVKLAELKVVEAEIRTLSRPVITVADAASVEPSAPARSK